MKTATYTLTIEFVNGNTLMQSNITQSAAYGILSIWQKKAWYRVIPQEGGREKIEYVKRWKIDSGWQAIQNNRE